MCQSDGLWSVLNAYCELTCPSLPYLPHARLMAGQGHCEGDEHALSTKCKMRCNAGYHVHGEDKNKWVDM